MLTIFSTAKPFKGHFGVIQRNAVTSWTLLRPKPEIILLGKEDGTAEVCRELSLRHVPDVDCNEYGTPLVSDLFKKAQDLASYSLLCYVNADIILMDDFLCAVEQVGRWGKPFLMIGLRWDLDIQEHLDFTRHDWESQLRELAMRSGRLESGIDYFVFPKGLLTAMPPLTVGRGGWDNWLVWHATHLKAKIVNATPSIVAVHQRHDYSHIPIAVRKDTELPRNDRESENNRELMRDWIRSYHYPFAYARYTLTPHGIRRNWVRPIYISLKTFWDQSLYYPLLAATRPLRHRFGIRTRH